MEAKNQLNMLKALTAQATCSFCPFIVTSIVVIESS
jgi:hypothetical protein